MGALGGQLSKAECLCLAVGLSGVECRPSAALGAAVERHCSGAWSCHELSELKQVLRHMGLWGARPGAPLVQAVEGLLLANFEEIAAAGSLAAFLRLFLAWEHDLAPGTRARVEGAVSAGLALPGTDPGDLADLFALCARLQVPFSQETLAAVAVVARERAVELRPRQLARLLAGFSALKWYPGDACMAACAARAQETLPEFSPECLSTYIRAVGLFRRKVAPGGDLLVAMAGRLHDWRAAGGMPTAEVVQLLKAFAGLGRHPGDGVVEAWMNAALEQKDILSPRHLSGLLWALARLRHAPRGDARVLVETFVRTACSTMSPRELSLSVWACGKIGLALSPETVGVVAEEALDSLPRVGGLDVLNLLWGLVKLDADVPPPLVAGLSARLAAPGGTDALRARELSNLLWSYAMLGQQPPDELLRAAEGMSRRYCKPTDASAFVWAHARLGRELPQSALDAFAEQFAKNASLAGSSRNVPELLSALIWGCGALDQLPHPAAWDALVSQVSLLASLGELSLTDMSRVLWAYQALGVNRAESAKLLVLAEEKISGAEDGRRGGKGRGQGRRQRQRDLSSIFITCARQQGAVPECLARALEDSVIQLTRDSQVAPLSVPEANELLWGYDKSGLSPSTEVLGALECSVLAAGDALDAAQVSTFMYFCASFDHVPGANLLELTEQKLLRGAKGLPDEALPLLTMAYQKFESLRKGQPGATSGLRKGRADGTRVTVAEKRAGGVRELSSRLIPLALFDADSLD